MIDIDPRLDARLRAFYEHIEEQRPSRVTRFHTRRLDRQSRGLNVVLISAALAVVTVAGAGFCDRAASPPQPHGSRWSR